MAMTSKEFGEMIGVSEAMASRLKSGARLPSRELLEKIAQVFEFDESITFAALRATREARTGDPLAFATFLKTTVFESSDSLPRQPS